MAYKLMVTLNLPPRRLVVLSKGTEDTQRPGAAGGVNSSETSPSLDYCWLVQKTQSQERAHVV